MYRIKIKIAGKLSELLTQGKGHVVHTSREMFAYSAHSCMRSTPQICWHVTAFLVDGSVVSVTHCRRMLRAFLACDENRRNG